MIALFQKLKAAETLAELEHLEARPNLSHRELHKRDLCIAALISMGSVAVPLLVRKLAKVSATDPAASVPQILEKIGDPAVPSLAKAMQDKNRQRRQNAISVLGRIATPAAVSALDDESVDLMDVEAVQHARREARHHGHPEGTGDLVDSDGRVRSGPGWQSRHDGLL